jgi:hypothetical protein
MFLTALALSPPSLLLSLFQSVVSRTCHSIATGSIVSDKVCTDVAAVAAAKWISRPQARGKVVLVAGFDSIAQALLSVWNVFSIDAWADQVLYYTHYSTHCVSCGGPVHQSVKECAVS